MVLTVYPVISSVIGLYCHRRRRSCLRQLDASVEASGPHDFAVRFRAVRQQHVSVHHIPPRVRDDRDRPSMGRDGAAYEVIWVGRERNYFSKQGWTGVSPERLSGKSACSSVGRIRRRNPPPYHKTRWRITVSLIRPTASQRARECTLDDGLREAIGSITRHCDQKWRCSHSATSIADDCLRPAALTAFAD
jgi:hypothetical protein